MKPDNYWPNTFLPVWYQFDKMTAESEKYSNEMRSSKGEISGLTRMISRLQNEIQNAKAQVSEMLKVKCS